MRIGMNLLLWTAFVTEEHLPLVSSLRELGFDGVELPLGGGDTAHYEGLAPGLRATGAAVTTCLGLEPENDPASPDLAVRAAAWSACAVPSTRRRRWAASCAAPLAFGSSRAAVRPRTVSLERRGPALRAGAATQGVTLALEPLNRFECYLANTVAQGLRLVSSRTIERDPSLRYAPHAHRGAAPPAIGRAATALGHVHIDQGRGQVAWGPTFEALRAADYDGWLTIEAFGTADPEFAAAIHIWRDFVDDPMTLAREGLGFIQGQWGQA